MDTKTLQLDGVTLPDVAECRKALRSEFEEAAVTGYAKKLADAVRADLGGAITGPIEVLVTDTSHAWELATTALGDDLGRLHFTRIVEGPAAAPAPVTPTEPLTVLFAVAAGIEDPRVRPASEYYGVLRACGRGGVGIRVVPHFEATHVSLADQVERLQPAIVHVVAHGKPDGLITMGNGEPNGQVDLDGGALAAALGVSKKPPALVVLNACFSGRGARTTEIPLAVELVRLGVPAVIAMGDEVDDRAARAFAWRLYESLLSGDSLPVAVGNARRRIIAAGFSPKTSVEWARPLLFRAPAATWAIQPDKGYARRADWMRSFDRGNVPRVLGDRTWVFDAPYRLLTQSRRDALAVLQTADEHAGKEKLGRTRALRELGKALVADGYLVLHVEQPTDNPNLGRVLLQIRDALRTTRRLLLDPPADQVASYALALLKQKEQDAGVALPPPVQAAYAENGDDWKSVETVRAALRFDLAALVRDVLAADRLAKERRRVFLLVDELQAWGGAATLMAKLVTRLDDYAIPDCIVSALVTVGPLARVGGSQIAVDAIKELANSASDYRAFPLGPFSAGEAQVAIGHWLLGHEREGAPKPLWWSSGTSPDTRVKQLGKLVERLGGTPHHYPRLVDAFDLLDGTLLEDAPDRIGMGDGDGH